jgi:RNA polymerase sigma factor (TIGR02999 family)
MHTQSEITTLLREMRGGDEAAMQRLVPLVYDDLRRIAHRHLNGEQAGHTVGTTGLVHEAYLRLAAHRHAEWEDRAHFFAAASQAMRRVLVDYARQHRAGKRGGALSRVPLDDAMAVVEERADLLLDLDEALVRLAALDERLGRVVECRFFGGLTEEETAEALGVTSRTVRRDWIKARGWLHAALVDDGTT